MNSSVFFGEEGLTGLDLRVSMFSCSPITHEKMISGELEERLRGEEGEVRVKGRNVRLP